MLIGAMILMNSYMIRLDGLKLNTGSYSFIPKPIEKNLNMEGTIESPGSFHKLNSQLKKNNFEKMIGTLDYDSLLRRPTIFILIPSTDMDFNLTQKKEYVEKIGMMSQNINNIAAVLSIAIWLIKDSNVTTSHFYHYNFFNGVVNKYFRNSINTNSSGAIESINLKPKELNEAITIMYEIWEYFVIEEKNRKEIKIKDNYETIYYEIEKSLSYEGKSFYRAFLLLQEARMTGYLPSKIAKYCACLECLFAIKKDSSKNIKNITASYLYDQKIDVDEIRSVMSESYGVRSDHEHGSQIKYLASKKDDELTNLSKKIDNYLRLVLKKILNENNEVQEILNYDNDVDSKMKARQYFLIPAREMFPEDYKK